MRRCEGFSRVMSRNRLEGCPYDALWDHQGHSYCHYHLGVVEGRLESSCWRPNDRAETEAERDPLLLLLKEWDLA